MRSITVEERRARLAERHLLLPRTRTDDVPTVADAVVALHSSDPVTVHLSVLARTEHPALAPIEAALYDDRTLVRHHAMRRTLWVARPETVRELHAAATLALVAPDRRRTAGYLAASGVEDPDVWLDDADARVLADLAEHGPSTARELGQRIEALRQPILVGGPRWGATQSAHTGCCSASASRARSCGPDRSAAGSVGPIATLSPTPGCPAVSARSTRVPRVRPSPTATSAASAR